MIILFWLSVETTIFLIYVELLVREFERRTLAAYWKVYLCRECANFIKLDCRIVSCMSFKKTRILRCPKCGWPFEVEVPDRLHPDCTTKKPDKRDVNGGIIEKVCDCNNPKCGNPITVYCYLQKLFFTKV